MNNEGHRKTSTKRKIIGIAVATVLAGMQTVVISGELNYRVSWLGNSFSGADDKWVQNFFVHMNVRPDGSCVTWSHWDEGGKKFGIYKDGDVIGNEDVGANSLEVQDREERQWKLHIKLTDPKHNEWDFTPERITCDGREVTFPHLHCPTALALDNNGWLMVADSWTSPRQQILFYDVTNLAQPVLKRTFGDYGGIGSGVPGQMTPTKLWGIRGIGVDAEDNLYVAMHEMGSVLRKFTPEGKRVWELFDHFFVDVASADPTTDAGDVWGIQEHYQLDWSQPPGKEATWVGYSLDRVKYPNDPRGLSFVKQQGEHGLTSPQIVTIEGKRFMFVGGMFASNFLNIFRYEGEMAIPSGLIMQWERGLYRTDLKWPPQRPQGTFIWRDTNGDGDYQPEEYFANTEHVTPGPFWVDRQGHIWMARGLYRFDCQGLDTQGNPIYQADKVTVLDRPQGVTKPGRVVYLEDSDTLVVADEGNDMRHISRVFICKGYKAGNRETVSFVPGAGPEAGCVAVVGDYIFTGGWKERGRIWVNRLSDGQELGVFDPGPTVGGVENTGWIDIFTGITAHKRRDGEYLIFVEDDGRAKVLVYRWRP